jgi:hypothetical protein
MGSRSYESTMVPDTECILDKSVPPSFFCYAVETKPRKRRTSRPQNRTGTITGGDDGKKQTLSG